MSAVYGVPEFLTAFEASAFLHEIFYVGLQHARAIGDDGVEASFKNLGVRENLFNPASTEKMTMDGRQGGLPIRETLSRDINGNFHFSVLNTSRNGPLVNYTFTPEGEQSLDPDMVKVVEHSLFMKAYRHLARTAE